VPPVDVTVVVATFGGDEWRDLANERAVPSALSLGVPVVTEHGVTLHDARNTGLSRVSTPFVCFLDADDELEPGYFEAMARGTADVRAPSVRYVDASPTSCAMRPVMPAVYNHRHDCTGDCLVDGNWLVVGSVARTELVRKVGGWRDFPLYEDWDLWLRCHLAGATFEAVPEAVYRAHVRRDSRNRAPDRSTRLNVHRAIARANGVPCP
jgi:glycosyltransferase involved in cell wall biosynthesis